jgi:glycosyltransferase involved in cell wall biosynthesis
MKSSVCMATYNGSKYLSIQLDSILSQLEDADEIIIVDDASTDNTCEIINSYQDKRIKLIRNESNIGVVKTFEKSISNAKGDIIFLSDQDDIWLPSKSKRIQEIFNTYSDITLVLSDASIIDEHGVKTHDSFFQIRGSFQAGTLSNIIKGKHHGCTVAFNRRILKFILPLPSDITVHDTWIGIVNSIYGKAFYIDEPLILHRRHSTNTGRGLTNRSSILQMLVWRFFILKNLCFLLIKHALSR